MDDWQTVKCSVVFASISVFAWICKLTVSFEWGKRREAKAKLPLRCAGDSKVQSLRWIPSLFAVGSTRSGVNLTNHHLKNSWCDWNCTEHKPCRQSTKQKHCAGQKKHTCCVLRGSGFWVAVFCSQVPVCRACVFLCQGCEERPGHYLSRVYHASSSLAQPFSLRSAKTSTP